MHTEVLHDLAMIELLRETPSRRVTTTIQPALHDRGTELAKRRGQSYSRFVRHLVLAEVARSRSHAEFLDDTAAERNADA